MQAVDLSVCLSGIISKTKTLQLYGHYWPLLEGSIIQAIRRANIDNLYVTMAIVVKIQS